MAMYSPPESLTRFLSRSTIESTVLIPLSDITSSEPSILGKGFLVKVRALVVTFEDGRTSDENLTLRRIVGGEVASFRGVDKLDFSSRNGTTDSSELHEGGVEDGGHGRRFSKAVTLNHNDQCCAQELLGALRDSTATAKQDLQVTTSLCTNSVENDSIGDSSQEWDRVVVGGLLGLEGKVENGLLESTGLVDLGENTFSDKFPNSRNTDHDRLRAR